MRVAALALALVAPALAGCVGQDDAVLTAQLDRAAPHCVGECARIVDESPARAWEPFLAVDPADPDHIVIADSQRPQDHLDYYRTVGRGRVSVTEDGGATWETRVVPSGLDVGPTHALAPYKTAGYDPVLVFLPDGALVMSALALRPVLVPGVPAILDPGSAIYTSRSTDGGRTWGDVRIVDGGEGVRVFDVVVGTEVGALFKFNDKGWMALGPDGTLLLVWSQWTQGHPDNGFKQETGGRLVFSSSADGGLTWAPVRTVDDDRLPVGASPVIGRDGTWRIAYLDQGGSELRFAESPNHGETWDVRTIGGASWIPAMRAQTLASGVERLLLAYATGGDFFGGQHQTELTWSDDGGSSWAPPVIIDIPQGEGPPMQDVVGAAGDGAWVTYFDVEGARSDQRSRYAAVTVVDGVAGAPLVLDEMDTAALNLGHYMGLGATPDGEAIVAWATYGDGEYDLAWARIRAGADYVPGDGDWARFQPNVPAGLDEPVPYAFTGHVDVPGCYLGSAPPLEQAASGLTSVTIEFDVPPQTRFVDGTLDWATYGPTPDTTDLDLLLYDPAGNYYDTPDKVPEAFHFELQDGHQGTWTAIVRNCENPPTDFTLDLVLS
jgi:hypothetical protein